MSNSSRSCAGDKIMKYILYFIIFACALTITNGYNINIGNIKIFNDPRGNLKNSRSSYFGFSTALYGGVDSIDLWSPGKSDAAILVGAPRANVTAISSVLEPGSVYKCAINNNNDCIEWNLDLTINGLLRVDGYSKVINQIKDNAWIGASIAVETNNTEPKVVVCAPRWRNNVIASRTPNWFMNGMCYWSIARQNEQRDIFERQADNRLIPLLGNNWQITTMDNIRVYNYGMGQTGASLHLYRDNDKDDSDILLGNPGVHNWKGIPLLIKTDLSNSRVPTFIIPQIRQEPLIHTSDYLGYSVSSGFYFERGERWYAAGAPRAGEMMGRVLIFRFPSLVADDGRLNVRKVLEGQQHGEYFGASLASCDINNDGKDEIIVGAPLWSKYMDEGRVYVYRQFNSNSEQFSRVQLEGEKIAGARFGSVITCLGDLDHDGYGDIAIGAPYEGDEQQGAIYIYNGGPTGLKEFYSQRITGKSVSSSIRGFGAAISEPRDIDGNYYADIAVGAYLSGNVVLLRSLNVVAVTVSLTFASSQPLIRPGNTTYFIVNFCASYDGYRVPRKIDVEKILKIDNDLLYAEPERAFYAADYPKNLNIVNNTSPGVYKFADILYEGSNTCEELKINLAKDIENVIEPMEMSVSLAFKSCNDCPVINQARSKLEDSIKIPFAVDCGYDNVCTSILDLTVSTATAGNGDHLQIGNRYTLGSKPPVVRLAIRVANHGEPAYSAQVHLFIPISSGIALGGIPPECTETDNPRIGINSAESRREDEFLEVTCQLGNPLRKIDGHKTLILELDMSDVRSNGNAIDKYADNNQVLLFANVSTRSIDDNLAKNRYNFSIYFDVDVDIAIAGKSQQDLYSYFNNDDQIMRFQHIYEVQKFGKSAIDESIVTVSVPTHWKKPNEDNYIEIASINETFVIMEGQRLFCNDLSNKNDYDKNVNSPVIDIIVDPTIQYNSTSNVPPSNRTLYLNCTDQAIKCTQISCKLSTFANSLTVAKFTITLDLKLKNLQADVTEQARDIIYFVSNGSVSMTQTRPIIDDKRSEDKPNSTSVATTFVGTPIAKSIALWIIVLSLILGLLLFLLLILALVKIGFFHRDKREKLVALKAESDTNHGYVLDISSSREILDENSY